MRTIRETGTREEIRVSLTQQATQHVKNTSQCVGSTRQCRRLTWLQQGSFRNVNFHQVVEAVVEHNLGVKHHDHVDPAEHLEHLLIEVEVNRADRLGVCAIKVENNFVFIAPHGALNSIRPHPQAIITNVILEVLLLLGNGIFNQFGHRALIAGKQLV